MGQRGQGEWGEGKRKLFQAEGQHTARPAGVTSKYGGTRKPAWPTGGGGQGPHSLRRKKLALSSLRMGAWAGWSELMLLGLSEQTWGAGRREQCQG